MKVLDLACANEHRFEGWFASDDDFRSQLERKLIECPLCGTHAVTRLPSAPRLNVSGAREQPPKARSEAPQGEAKVDAEPTRSVEAVPVPADARAAALQQMQAQWVAAVKEVIANTEDVGPRFAEEARRIHYGEAEERAIRGKTSLQEAEALREEGIEVAALPIPAALLKGPMQ